MDIGAINQTQMESNARFMMVDGGVPWFSMLSPWLSQVFLPSKPPRKAGSTFRYRGATGEGDDRRPSAGQTPGDHGTRRTGKIMEKSWENLGNPWNAKKPPCSMANKSKKMISQ